MSDADILEALAEAAEAAAAVFRRRAALARPQPQAERRPGTVLDLARQIHPMLGQRQAEVVGELEKVGAAGPRQPQSPPRWTTTRQIRTSRSARWSSTALRRKTGPPTRTYTVWHPACSPEHSHHHRYRPTGAGETAADE